MSGRLPVWYVYANLTSPVATKIVLSAALTFFVGSMNLSRHGVMCADAAESYMSVSVVSGCAVVPTAFPAKAYTCSRLVFFDCGISLGIVVFFLCLHRHSFFR